jgi:hypothetical protein
MHDTFLSARERQAGGNRHPRSPRLSGVARRASDRSASSRRLRAQGTRPHLVGDVRGAAPSLSRLPLGGPPTGFGPRPR